MFSQLSHAGAAAFRAPWMPDRESSLLPAGVHFDGIRVRGVLGRETADALIADAAGSPGPIVVDTRSSAPATAIYYFLVPPASAAEHRWPPGVMALHLATHHVGVPALWGNTWPLAWVSPPTHARQLVDPAALHRVLCDLTGWSPRP